MSKKFVILKKTSLILGMALIALGLIPTSVFAAEPPEVVKPEVVWPAQSPLLMDQPELVQRLSLNPGFAQSGLPNSVLLQACVNPTPCKNNTPCCTGYHCVGNGNSASCVLDACGDGIINGSETCDDGNTISGDGCSATCQTETPACIQENDACQPNASCCPGLTCCGTTNRCKAPQAACKGEGGPCGGCTVCCAGLVCSDPQSNEAGKCQLACQPVNCVVSGWGACIEVSQGVCEQSRTITTAASCGGTACPALTQPCQCVTQPVCGNGSVETGEQCELPNTDTCDANCQTIIQCPAAGVCPTECGYGGGTVPDGQCETLSCPATAACPPGTPPQTPPLFIIPVTGADVAESLHQVTLNLGLALTGLGVALEGISRRKKK